LAAEIKVNFPNAEVVMARSSGGRFEVFRDGAPVFEKSKTKRHAEPGEIVELLKSQSR
jgi:selT/selW/selH-like putative selenoprotein